MEFIRSPERIRLAEMCAVRVLMICEAPCTTATNRPTSTIERATFIAGSVVIPRTATDADIAEQLQWHQDDSSGGVVDPAAEEQVGEHERGVEIPDTAP